MEFIKLVLNQLVVMSNILDPINQVLSAHFYTFINIFLTLLLPSSASLFLFLLSTFLVFHSLHFIKRVGILPHNLNLIKLQITALNLAFKQLDSFFLTNQILKISCRPICHKQAYKILFTVSSHQFFQEHIFHIKNILFLLSHFLLLAV